MRAFRFEDVRIEYDALGYDTIPLSPNTKDPIGARWQMRPSAELWQHAPSDANIGIRAGGVMRVAVLDADNKHDAQTSQNATRYLAGMGIDAGDCPIVATVNGGAHFYLRLVGESFAGNARHLAHELGAGEFRYGNGAQCAAPPSEIDGRVYRLTAGDWRQLPPIEARDILPILANQDTTATATLATPTISRKAWALLQGKGSYASRSEAEQAIIASLVNTGHDFDSVLSLFIRFPCAGKFSETYAKHPKRAMQWLKHSFDEARQWTSTRTFNGKRIAEQAIVWAESRAWPGRTGTIDKVVFIAHATLANRAGRIEYAAACRDLAELASVSHETATRATHRLIDAGLLALEKTATVTLANTYRLKLPTAQSLTLTNYSIVSKCQTLRQTQHDAFRARGLGKSAGEVWGALQQGGAYVPLRGCTIAELAGRTGRHEDTVTRALERMAHIVDGATDEVVSMVERDGSKWRACNEVDLDAIARMVGTHGASERQRKQHAEERAKRRTLFERGKQREQRFGQVATENT
jgi:hypothetical protein